MKACLAPFRQVTDSKGWDWRLMIMPLGNSSESYGNLSIFVEHANKDRLKEEVCQDIWFLHRIAIGFPPLTQTQFFGALRVHVLVA